VPRRKPPAIADPDAVQQRVTDLEALLVSPGWAWLCLEANKRYGQRVFTDGIEALARTFGDAPEVLAARTLALASARMAAGVIINLPGETLADLKRKLATQQGDAPPAGLGANVEVSRGDADAH